MAASCVIARPVSEDVGILPHDIWLIIATESGEPSCPRHRAPEVRSVRCRGSWSALQVVGRFVQAGIEHIPLGYDHIAFLAAIVLWAQRLWPVIKIVTAFTIAHSITLSLAALQIVVFPSAIVNRRSPRRSYVAVETSSRAMWTVAGG